MYTRISDKVVGILLRAKKYGLLYFEPEMLFQVEGFVFGSYSSCVIEERNFLDSFSGLM